LVGRWFVAPWLDHISREMQRLAIERLEIDRFDRVLEVGFGGGRLLRDLASLTGADVFGVDISRGAVERLRRRLGARASLYEGTAERLPLGNGSVDKAVSLNSLYFWPSPEAAFAELARVLRPGGRLVLGFEPPEELAKWPGSRFGFRAFGQAEVEEMLRSGGFSRIETVEGRGRKPARFLILSADRRHANG
jgi:SAM-dependent methyltransferase